MPKSKKELIEELISQVDELPHRDENKLDALLRKSEMIIRNTFGETSKYLTDLKRVHFHPSMSPTTEEYHSRRWQSGQNELRNLFQTMMEELSIFGNEDKPGADDTREEKKESNHQSPKVFIVHGRDDVAKVKVARFLEKLGIKPIILHEQPNNGRTIIEKFEGEASDVDFAVVLLTGDDRGAIKDSEENSQPRARQNVIFELGYFMGVLSRSRVVALKETGIELPSDYAGILYVDLDDQNRWELELAKEMKNAGINLDLNKAI
jgi:predicted nucleotide-binding protein